VIPVCPCGTWTSQVLEKWDNGAITPELKAERAARKRCFTVEHVTWDIKLSKDDHCAINVTFCDGETVYLDDGWLAGKGRHIFNKRDIPWRYFEETRQEQ
jgi:hypothetical protein